MSMRVITHIVLHYSATFADQEITAADIDRMHRARGWKMIGYHWFIRRDGLVEMGRPETMVGAHVGGQNSGKIGICCAGGLDRATGPNRGVDNRTDAQIAAQIALVKDILRRHPGAKVVGHRDLAATQCPGFDVRPWWAWVEGMKLPDPNPVPDDAPVTTPGVAEDAMHVVEAGDTLWAISREHDVELDNLTRWNPGIDPNDLAIGSMILVLPPAGTPSVKDTETRAGGLLGRLWAWLKTLFNTGD